MPARTSPLPAVARSGGALAVDRDPAVGGGNHRVGALQHDDRTALPRRPPRPFGLAAGGIEEAGELALVRGHHHRRADRREQGVRIAGERGQRIGVEHRPLAGCEDRQGLVAGFAADPGARTDQRGIAPPIREQAAKVVEAGDRVDDDPGQRRGVDRKRGFGRGHGDEPGAEPGGAAGGEPGGPGHHRAAGHERVPAGIFMAVEDGPGQIGEPPGGVVCGGVGANLVEHRDPGCRSAPAPSRRTGSAPAAAGGPAFCGRR